MNSITRLGWTALILAAAIVVADQTVKHWILSVLNLPLKGVVPVAGPLRLTMVWNPGVSFGFLQGEQQLVRWLLAAFSIGVSILLAGWVRKAERPLFALAVGLVIGGALGNVIDRIRLGAVADFIDVSQLYFPWVFNVADSAISVGICLLLIDMLRQDGRDRAAKASDSLGKDAA
jgi:signal peptidase II